MALFAYGFAIAWYYAEKGNRRPGEEHGFGKTRFFIKPNLMQANCSDILAESIWQIKELTFIIGAN